MSALRKTYRIYRHKNIGKKKVFTTQNINASEGLLLLNYTIFFALILMSHFLHIFQMILRKKYSSEKIIRRIFLVGIPKPNGYRVLLVSLSESDLHKAPCTRNIQLEKNRTFLYTSQNTAQLWDNIKMWPLL